MRPARRTVLARTGSVTLVAVVTVALAAAPAQARRAAPAHRHGRFAPYLPSDKSGFGTAHGRASDLWYTLQPHGGTGELYYPTLDTPAARRLDLVVTGNGHVQHADRARTTIVNGAGLSYRQVLVRRGAWRLSATYVTDPARATLLTDVTLTSLDGAAHRLYVTFEPTIGGTPGNDRGRTVGRTLVASDPTGAGAVRAVPRFTATDNGYRNARSPLAALRAAGHLRAHRARTAAGYLVQAGRTAIDGLPGRRHLVLAAGFAASGVRARAVARRSLAAGFAAVARRFAAGWNAYLGRLRRPPSSLRTPRQVTEYRVSEMVLAASEDKRHPGAYVASPTMPWVWGAQRPSGPYHLVWSRDLYEIATALIADGDRAGANRALDFLFGKQQKANGSFPQNSTVSGKEFWTGLQLDEVADPILLAYQLHRFGPHAWRHVERAADFLLSFSQDGYHAPYTPQERWENQSGYSPATIASEIAGLVCAAVIAKANGQDAKAGKYYATADRWRRHLKGWTVTTNGPYSPKPYFLRLTKDGKPDKGTTYAIGDSGPAHADQRSVVDPSFLELVRLGVLPWNDRDVRNTLRVVDKKLGYRTARGMFWHRASFDGYGETSTGKEWTIGNPDNSFLTHGRGWPLLTGERGEYDLLAGKRHAALAALATMARSANAGYLLPEQVWDHRAPAGRPGFQPGTPTLSATPLAWTHAQYIRLAVDASVGQVLEQPAAVADRYLRGGSAAQVSRRAAPGSRR